MVRTLVVLILLTRVARADDEEALYNCKRKPTAVQVNLKPEIEVKELIAWAVGFTCKQIVYDARIITGRKVTVIAPGPQTPEEAYKLFETALHTIGYAAVKKGKTLRIIDAPSAVTETVPLVTKGAPTGDSIVRYVLRPKHAQPETLRQAFTAMKSKDGNVTLVGPLLVLTDYGSNVRDMLSIGKLVDVPGGSEGIYTIPVIHADATKLHEKLNTLLAAPAAAPAKPGETAPPNAAAPSKLLVDDRTNTLIVAGSEASYERVKALVERLDIALDTEGGTTMHVYQLGSAIAEELAKTINEAIQTQTQAKPGSKDSKDSKDGLGLEGQAKVISDKPTNKLIVMSSGRDFLAIREVIRALDVPRRQVFIEATILEVQVGNGLDLGSASHGGIPVDNGNSLLVGGVQTKDLRSIDLQQDKEKSAALGTLGSLASLAGASGLIGGLVSKTSILGTTIPSYAVLFQALATNGSTNVLSSPSILVLDNEEAKFKVGSNVPYQKGVMPTSPTANSSLTTNIDRKDLLLELNIKPHISTDDSILLEVVQSSEDIGEDGKGLGPSWSTRSFTTRVLVHDQQTIVMSGMMQERETRETAKVPLLGDIPILGYLFKYTKRAKRKTNLLVMITPYIIKNHADLDEIRARKQRDHDEFFGSLHALDGMKYMPRVDYRRKRGLVEEINRTVLEIEADAAARGTIREQPRVKPGLVETP